MTSKRLVNQVGNLILKSSKEEWWVTEYHLQYDDSEFYVCFSSERGAFEFCKMIGMGTAEANGYGHSNFSIHPSELENLLSRLKVRAGSRVSR